MTLYENVNVCVCVCVISLIIEHLEYAFYIPVIYDASWFRAVFWCTSPIYMWMNAIIQQAFTYKNDAL